MLSEREPDHFKNSGFWLFLKKPKGLAGCIHTPTPANHPELSESCPLWGCVLWLPSLLLLEVS